MGSRLGWASQDLEVSCICFLACTTVQRSFVCLLFLFVETVSCMVRMADLMLYRVRTTLNF